MQNSNFFLAGLLVVASANASCVAQNSAPVALSRATLIQTDFENAGWPNIKPSAIGTIDVAGSTKASQGLAGKSISSGPLALKNNETNLGKLTLAFSLSAKAATPVTVRIESFDADKKTTGALETQIFPPAPDFYQRFALDLDKMKPSGAGKFVPDAPFVGFSFQEDEGGEIRLDNVQFAKPAFYVSEKGKDTNDGRTEETAFVTPQKALDVAGAGDIIAVMNGTYKPVGVQEGIARFKKPGAPAAWISLKNYPGHTPLFNNKGSWGAVRFLYNNAQATADKAANVVAPVPAYIEVRGLHIRGNGDTAKAEFPDLVGKAAPETNSNGISVQWDGDGAIPHHLRFADNLVEFCPGAGIGPGSADWVTVENNTIRNNCWTTIYATSGISLNHGSNFTGVSGAYTQLIRNNETSGNRTFEIWKQIGKISDGNGIIIDVNQDKKLPEEQRFQGRTLISNNVSFNNGGSGIHAFKSARVDIINNTVYMNSASPELPWGQLFVQQCDDVRMINNLVVAPPDQPINTVGEKSGDQNSTNIFRAGNLYFGGSVAPIMGEGDVVADPQFVNPSIDAEVADFRLKPTSPALGIGKVEPITPATNIDGKARGAKPNAGAF